MARICSMVLGLVLCTLAAVPPMRAQSAASPNSQRLRAGEVVEILSAKLKLTDEQKTKIEPIITERQQQLAALRADNSMRRMKKMRSMKKVIDSSDAAIKAVLTDEQQQQYTDLEKQLREAAKERRSGATSDSRGALSGNGAAQKAEVPEGVRVMKDIAYGTDPAERMDVYLPPNARRAVVIFMVHGGGWSRGDKEMGRVVANKVSHWVPQGYVFVSINYRMLPEAGPLEQANDVAKALAFAQGKATTWGADPSRFVLMGHSAGAHLVSLLAADPNIAQKQGAKPWLGTVSLDSAALDVVETMNSKHLPLYDDAFGKDPGYWAQASPYQRLGSATKPMMLVCSSRRNDSCPQAQKFAAKLKSMNGKAVVLPMDLSHAEVNEELGQSNSYTDAVDTFLRSLER